MRKVAIVVKGATNALAPWQDESWEIWGLPWISYPRVTRFFEIHEPACYIGPDEHRDEIIARNRAECPEVPVYCTKAMADNFAKPVPYPFDEVIGSLPFPFLEDSVSYMIALAIYEGVDELALYGVHMMGAYASHRPAVTHLIGLACGKGMKVTVSPGSPLFMSMYTQGRYGITLETR